MLAGRHNSPSLLKPRVEMKLALCICLIAAWTVVSFAKYKSEDFTDEGVELA